MKRKTIFSQCSCNFDHPELPPLESCYFRKYRYTLWREFDDAPDLITGLSPDFEHAEKYVQFIGLNPSTADEVQDDPTIRRCIDFSKRWGFGAYCMTNIFGWRDTDPEKMKAIAEPVGRDNDKHIMECARNAGLIIAAWGKHGSHMKRGEQVVQLLKSNGIKLHCLKKNDDGSPAHPLYLKATLTPIEYP